MENSRSCPACLDNGHEIRATWSLPQSLDAGKTVFYVDTCDMHQKDWWAGADWDGKHLERRLVK